MGQEQWWVVCTCSAPATGEVQREDVLIFEERVAKFNKLFNGRKTNNEEKG